jgi:hypothetical protein
MNEKIELKIKCPSCKGTGLYEGMGERSGSAVVCHKCKGTGCYNYIYEYEKFTEKALPKEKIKRVFEANPGICIGENEEIKLKDFGGMSYNDWQKGRPFPPKSEMRKFTCPCWWYQIINYDLKPSWKECIWGGSFSHCSNFQNKADCWKKWDKEYKGKNNG